MEALPCLKAITASSKMKKKTKTPVERLEILTKQFPPDATLVGHLWYTAAPSLHVQAKVPPPMDRFLLLLDTPVFGPGFFIGVICQVYGLRQFRFSDWGLRISDCGKVALLRQRIFLWGFCTGGLKERLRTHPPSLRSGTLPTPGRAWTIAT